MLHRVHTEVYDAEAWHDPSGPQLLRTEKTGNGKLAVDLICQWYLEAVIARTAAAARAAGISEANIAIICGEGVTHP